MTTSSKPDGPLGKAPDIAVGASDRLLLGVSVFGFGVITYLVYSYILSKVKSAREMREEERDRQISFEEKLARADVSTLNRAQRRARARLIMKQQRRIDNTGLDEMRMMDDDGNIILMPDDQMPLRLEDEENEEDFPQFDDDAHYASSSRHLSRKERQKAAKQIEIQERKVLEEERRKEQEELQQKERIRKLERERKKASQMEEERKKRQQQRAAEELAAYHSWRIFLPRPKPGASTEMELPKGFITVKEWKKELCKDPIVTVSELSRRFWVSKQEVRERISELLETDRITGVLDADRFIHLSTSDLVSLSGFLKAKDTFDSTVVQAKIDELVKS
ncbi:DDRGK domain containing protein [Nitzschia inconspicua]|uniref:DDRGK domain containing protein n=1 Tax=Nitzschia inconspicua TaxID=303405 RepID=A0A9K3LZF8_9STRA|nr:DDRGK domain containing protein [Nitzschia inconspicua]